MSVSGNVAAAVVMGEVEKEGKEEEKEEVESVDVVSRLARWSSDLANRLWG